MLEHHAELLPARGLWQGHFKPVPLLGSWPWRPLRMWRVGWSLHFQKPIFRSPMLRCHGRPRCRSGDVSQDTKTRVSSFLYSLLYYSLFSTKVTTTTSKVISYPTRWVFLVSFQKPIALPRVSLLRRMCSIFYPYGPLQFALILTFLPPPYFFLQVL